MYLYLFICVFLLGHINIRLVYIFPTNPPFFCPLTLNFFPFFYTKNTQQEENQKLEADDIWDSTLLWLQKKRKKFHTYLTLFFFFFHHETLDQLFFIYFILVSAAANQPCVPRTMAGGDSVVCVCNSTYCDTVPEMPTLTPGMYAIYTSSRDGDRFNLTTAKVSSSASSGCKLTQVISHRQIFCPLSYVLSG